MTNEYLHIWNGDTFSSNFGYRAAIDVSEDVSKKRTGHYYENSRAISSLIVTYLLEEPEKTKGKRSVKNIRIKGGLKNYQEIFQRLKRTSVRNIEDFGELEKILAGEKPVLVKS